MSSPLVHKKPVPYYVKRSDGELISRADLQYDLLSDIFTDDHAVFTDHNPTVHGDPVRTKVNFRDLYVNTLIRSPRVSKVLRDKMLDVPDFATDFAKLALLANVGRINTTMAFFPEMKTLIRTYHPIPALQKSNGNLQDAPRIKNILKSCLLDGEVKAGVPTTPVDILSRLKSGKIPSTSVVNLVFVMANHAAPLAQIHFDNTFDFLDLFLPINISSASRARAFLWLCYHYLESPDTSTNNRNPFTDPLAPETHRIPRLVTLTPEEMERENVDTEEEVQWAEGMTLQRKRFQANMDKGKGDGSDGDPGQGGADAEVKTPRKAVVKDPIAAKAAAKERKAISDKARRERQKEKKRAQASAALAELEKDGTIAFKVTPEVDRGSFQQYVSPSPSSHPPKRQRTPSPSHPHRHSPYKPSATPSTCMVKPHALPPGACLHSRGRSPPRTMLQQAWHVVTTIDPLLDSDDELGDEHLRLDYVRRLNVLCMIRGKELTPEPPSKTAHGYAC